MRRFKEFYYTLLSETPMNIGDTRDDYSLDTIMAKEKYSEIKNNSDLYNLVRKSDSQISVDLYEEQDGNEIICWFVPVNNSFVSGYVAYNILDDGGIITTSVYNDKQVKFLAYKVYLYYLIERYEYILSDKRHTQSGKRFWENLVLYALGNNYNVYVVDLSKNDTLETITNINQLKPYYGDEYSEKYRIKIEKP